MDWSVSLWIPDLRYLKLSDDWEDEMGCREKNFDWRWVIVIYAWVLGGIRLEDDLKGWSEETKALSLQGLLRGGAVRNKETWIIMALCS